MSEQADNIQTVRVVIFGEEYSVRGTDNPEYIYSVADYVDKTMREIAAKNKSMPPNRVAILAALNLAGELFDLRRDKTATLDDVESRARNIVELLDKKFSPADIG